MVPPSPAEPDPMTDTPAWVYLLACRDGSLYCGWTTDLDRRLAAHSAGRGARYTRGRLPVRLAFAAPMPDRSAALREEARIKRLPRAAKLALLAAPPAPDQVAAAAANHSASTSA